MVKKKTFSAEYMKIRRYVLNLLHRSKGEMIQLPTSEALAKQFDCSRPTVAKAMKTLIEDGYVIGKPGIGTFTNPAMGFKNIAGMPIIGIIFGDGMLVHYEIYFGSVLAQVLEQFIRFPALVHIINLTSNSPDQIIKQIMAEELDGLLWETKTAATVPVLKELRRRGLPVIALNNGPIPEVDCVYFDMDRLGDEIGRRLIAQNRRQVVCLADREPWNVYRSALVRAYENAGLKLNDKLFIHDSNESLSRLREFLELGVPIDAVINPVIVTQKILDVFDDLEIERREKCCLVNNGIYMNQPIPGGIRYDLPFHAYVGAALQRMTELLKDKNAPPEQIPIEVPVIQE